MARIIRIIDPKNIATILDVIHDCWFDRDEITFDAEQRILSVRFIKEVGPVRIVDKKLFLKRVRVPMIECFLRIYSVKEYKVTDTEKVGKYDFNEIKYDPYLNLIRITTGIPLDITLQVVQFDVAVEETDNIIEEKEKLTIW